MGSASISKKKPQRVHVGIWYIHRAQRGSHIPTLRPKCIPYSYMDPLGPAKCEVLVRASWCTTRFKTLSSWMMGPSSQRFQ